jgi:hypothetical protein
MKTKIFFSLLFILGFFVMVSCKKDKDEVITVTVDDAKDLIANSMEPDTYGISSQLEVAAQIIEDYLLPAYCGYSGDSTILKYYGGSAVQYNYTFNWTWLVNCGGINPTLVDVNYHSTGDNANTLMSSTFSADGDFEVTGLAVSDSDYVFNGTYHRSGDVTTKVRNKLTFSSTLDITIAGLIMHKTTYLIKSGSAAITLNCVTSDNQSFDFTGIITFNGNQNCTLTLNGVNYTIQI